LAAGFFFFASADSDTSSTSSATTNASARAGVDPRDSAEQVERNGNRHTHTAFEQLAKAIRNRRRAGAFR
jgi:hypothetical protein